MNQIDTRISIDPHLMDAIGHPMRQDNGDALLAPDRADGGVHTDYGGNLNVFTNIGPTTAIGTSGNFTNQDVNGIVSGRAWDVTGGQTITFSFPTKGAFYGDGYGSNEPGNDFTVFTGAQKEVVRFALDLISQYTGIQFEEIHETKSVHATLRFAGSSVPSTSWAYYPAASAEGGDVWLGNVKDIAPTKAGYAFDTIMHEIGHAMGLKHGHQDDGVHGVLPTDHDSTEWSLMTYHSFVGADEYYRNSDGSGNQSYMIDDIAAFQYIYGANYNTNSGKTTYTWNKSTGEMYINGVGQGASETNTIYEAIWDGGGKDTYDLRKYRSDLDINLNPGEWSTFDTAQLANLDSSNPGVHLAHGNIANAHLFEGNLASLIENANGGSGDDAMVGNVGKNRLAGYQGDDTLSGGDGKDLLIGGRGHDDLYGEAGKDTFLFTSTKDSKLGKADVIHDLTNSDVIDLSRIDADINTGGDQAFHLTDAFHEVAGDMVMSYNKHTDVTTLRMDVDGDTHADMVIELCGKHTAFDNFVL